MMGLGRRKRFHDIDEFRKRHSFLEDTGVNQHSNKISAKIVAFLFQGWWWDLEKEVIYNTVTNLLMINKVDRHWHWHTPSTQIIIRTIINNQTAPKYVAMQCCWFEFYETLPNVILDTLYLIKLLIWEFFEQENVSKLGIVWFWSTG